MSDGGNRQRNLLTAVGVLAAAGAGYLLTSNQARPAEISWEDGPTAKEVRPTEPAKSVTVHITGLVKKPGVYEFPAKTNVKEAIARAEPLPSAAPGRLNLAAKLIDGTRIEVPGKAGAPPSGSRTTRTVRGRPAPNYDLKPLPLAGIPSDMSGGIGPGTIDPGMPSAYLPKETVAANKKSSSRKALPTGKISLNTSTAEQLQALPGVAASTAENIIQYRQAHGGFATIDELLKVKGIGPKKFDQMRPYVSL